ncbi:MAG: hypothetical protein WBA84_03815 [Carnobacterium sp.]|uniref:hypothetical protein n=1 Tax=Carnobacterium sp. TaxID=48221 RepID=UPI003C789EBA
MLKTNKQINLNGASEIDGVIAVNLNSNIQSETGVGSINQYVQNVELYEANKVQVRKDIAEFQNMVYAIEDEIATEKLV